MHLFTGTHSDYHRPSDDLNLQFDWTAAAKFARVNFLLARELANAAEPPRWYVRTLTFPLASM